MESDPPKSMNRQAIFFVLILLAANVVLGAFQLSQRRAGGEDADFYRNLDEFGQVLRLIRENYVDPDSVEYETMVEEALKHLLRSLDSHSDYLSRDRFSDLQSETKQQFGGVGIQIEARDGAILVIAPIAGTPADEAGVLAGDRIVQVDEEDTRTASLRQIVDLLRGEPGTKVDLTVYRQSTEERLTFTLERAIIQVDSVFDAEILEGDVGYVRLTQFGDRTKDELQEALEGLLEETELEGLILDLRNNPGGLLTAAVDVADLFFDRNQLIVFTQGRDPDKRQNLRSRRGRAVPEMPIAVLLNGGSASASEIVAGALRDSGRGFIVGETSFGKGSVQSILPLRSGDALRLTTSLYYTPSGISIHEKGIIPDVEVAHSVEEESKLRLQRNRRDLLKNPEEFLERYDFEPIPDRQLKAALEILRMRIAGLTMEEVQEQKSQFVESLPEKEEMVETPEETIPGDTDAEPRETIKIE
ncbi:MAG: S41 family peptidase [Opitutales bacterium]|nr:S41 family peptidase [Opitutales bacterium]MCH8541360.1 S41 family peptidase [Opitutales bacterium]